MGNLRAMGEAPRDDAAGLTRAGEGVAEVAETTGALRAGISNAMVGLKARWYGKGPERARTYLADDDVFVVMEGGLTRNEETLVAAGQPRPSASTGSSSSRSCGRRR